MSSPNVVLPGLSTGAIEHATEETTPLLQTSPARTPEKVSVKASYVLLIVCLLLTLLDFGGYLNTAPQTAIFEKIICDDYYNSHNGGEEVHGHYLKLGQDPCKIKPIQGELAVINGWKDMFEQVPGILLAIPYGLLADRIGRKPVLFMGLLGITASESWIKTVTWFPSVFHIRLVWAGSLFQVIGGGAQVATSMFYVIVTDVYKPADRANAYFKVAASVLISEAVATPLSGVLMLKNPWVPYMLAYAVIFVGFLLILTIPETMPISDKAADTDDDEESVIDLAKPTFGSFLDNLKHRLRSVRAANSAILNSSIANSNMLLLLFTFCVANLSRQAMFLLLQYASRRFEWSFAKASLLMSVRAGTNLVVLLIVLPALTAYLLRNINFSAVSKDLFLLRTSGIFLALGSFIIGLAWTPALLIIGLLVIALGSGFILIARSLAAALASASERGVLFTAIAVISGAGQFIAGPFLASTFKKGMDIGGWAYGLPFLVTGLLYISATLAVFLVRVTDEQCENEILAGIEEQRTES